MDMGDRALDIALTAAIEASRDLEDSHIPLNDITDRNEHWVTSYVGCRLNDEARTWHKDKEKSVWVTYEARTSWMEAGTGARLDGGPAGFSQGQRFDLAVWDNKRSIQGLVEIKNAPGMDAARFKVDALRLRDAIDCWGLRQGGSLRWGVALFSCRLTRAQVLAGSMTTLATLGLQREQLLRDALGPRLAAAKFKAFDEGDSQCCLAWSAVLVR